MTNIVATPTSATYALVADPSSGCAIGGTITHDLTGDALLIHPDSNLALLEVSSTELTKPFDPPSGRLYKISVFEYLSSDTYGPYYGRGFTLYLFTQEDGPWELDGSGVFHRYEPAGYADIMYMKGRLPLTGSVEGLNADGSGGHVTGHLEPANPRAVFAAYYTLDLEIQCGNSTLAT
jgi:hypothetical protein